MTVSIYFQKQRRGYWKSYSFAVLFNEMFNLHPDTETILHFRDVTDQKVCKKLQIKQPLETYTEPTYKNPLKLDWSCKPRSKPLCFIESVHDLPRIKTGVTNIIDWSAKGQIAAIFSKKLVIWTPNTEETIAYPAQNITGIAFNPAGDTLAVATWGPGPCLRLINKFRPNRKENVTKLKYFSHLSSIISCLTWDCSGKFIACGLEDGRIITIRVKSLEHMNRDIVYPRHAGYVLEVKFSLTSKYLASASECGQLYIWSWNNYKLTPLIAFENIKYGPEFDWHPWRDEEIIIGKVNFSK